MSNTQVTSTKHFMTRLCALLRSDADTHHEPSKHHMPFSTNSNPNSSKTAEKKGKRCSKPFPAKPPLCVIRLRRARKVYTIDCAICSLLEVIDAV